MPDQKWRQSEPGLRARIREAIRLGRQDAHRAARSVNRWQVVTMRSTPVRVDMQANGLRRTLTDHYLAGIECDHDTARDRPVCACSRVDLGWHPNIGEAVKAWVDHVIASGRSEGQRNPHGEVEKP